uniref:DNA-directed RNA polymerase n=1 Tax=Chlamydomonas moewusii TaxID=3054 RepID=B2X2C2_CHLMO|nr:RNA polymerase beta'' subunit [Chlamydomonas moewusii]
MPQRSILSLNDTLFLYSGLFPKNRYFADIKTEKSLKINNNKPLINPTNWEPSFSVFLNWFPKRFFTKTAGILFLELFSPTNKKISLKNETRSDTINIFSNSIGSFLTPSNTGAGAFTTESRKDNKYKSQYLRLTSMLPSRTSRVTRSYGLQRAERVDGDKHTASLDKSPLDFTINFSSRINTKIDELHPSSRNASSIERGLSLKRLFTRNNPTDKTNKFNKLNNLVKTSLQKSLKKSSINNARIATTVPTFFKNELLVIRPTEGHIGNQFSFGKKSTTPVLDSFDNVGSSVGEPGVHKRPFLSTNSQMLELPQSETSTGVNSPLEKEKSFTLTEQRQHAERVDVALINKQTIGELAQTLVHSKFTRSVRGQQYLMTTKNFEVPSKASTNIEISASDGRRQSIKTKGFFWKNHFKYNWSGPLQQKANRHYVNTQSVLTRSQLNNTIISSQRVFWVSQPFYKIHDKNNSIFINIVENFDGLQSGPEPTTQLGPHFKGSKINRYNSKPSHNGVFSLSENTTHLQKTMPIKSIKNSNENSPALVLSQINRQGQIHFNSFDPNLVQISKIKTTFNSQWPIDRERQTFVEASTINKTTSLDFNTSTGSGHNYKNQFFPNIKQNQSSKRLRQRAERVDNENMDCRYIKLTKGQLIGRLMYKQREFDKNQTNIQTRSLLCKKNNLLAHSVNTVNKNFLVDLKTFCRLNSPVDQYITSPAPFLLAKKKDLIINKKLNLVIDSFLGMKALNLYRKRLPSRTSRFTRSSVLQSAERIETNPDSSLQVQHQKHKRIRTSELALFDFYFYSLFTKQFNKTQPKVESMHQVNRSELRVLTEQTSLLRNKKNFKNKENNYKHICSPYLKEQFSKYLPNLSPIFKTKNRLIWSSYNNKSIQYHLFSEKHRQMFQRVNYLRHWFKKRNAFASMRVGQQINTLRQKKRNNIKRLSLQSTAKQNETESNIENFLNIWLKNGWFYYTTDLTQFLLNHKKLLPAGKNFDSHFIFDRDNIYIEILPLNQLPSLKTFVIGSSSSVDRLKKVTSKSDNSTSDRSVGGPKETLFGGAKQRPSVTGLLTERQQMSLKKQALQSVLVKHDLAESKTLPRRRLSNTKQSLFIKQQSWLTFIEKRTENILVTVTSTFNKKTEESTETLKHLNFKKVLINKKCRFNFNIDTNNASKSKNIDALPVTEPKHDIVRKSSNIESVTENTTNWSTTNNLLFKNQAKAAGTCQKNSYILLISKANEIPFFKEIESKKEIYELSKQQKQASNLYNLNKYQTYMLSPERRVKQIDENKTVNSLSFSIKKRSVNFALCAKFRMLIKTKNILKMLSNQSKTKMLNKVYNTSRLYTEYKTGIFNKQTITPQILSKYPSSELKIISNNSFSSFLSENEIDRQSNNVTEHTSKSVENSLTFKNNSNILSPLNKEHSAVLPTLMVTCLKTFNLAPFILSYKAPYSVNFPFKTPMCFFSEQYKPTKLFKKNHNTSPAALPRANITQKPLESKKVESTIFKKVISTYLLKIYLLHSSELDIAPKKIKDGQSPNKKENSAINGVFSKVVNKDSMAQALQSKYTRSASRLEAFFHSGPMGNAAPELRASREVQGYHRKIANTFSNLASMFFVPIAEYSLLNDFPKSIGSLNGDLLPVPTKQTLAKRLTNSSAIDNKKYLFGLHNNTSNVLARNTGSLFKGRSSLFAFGGDHELLTNKNKLYSIHFVSYINNTVNSQHPCIKTYAHSSVNGELIYRKKNLKPIDLESPLIYNELMTLKKSIPDLSIKKMLRQKLTDYFLSNKKVDHIDHSCMILTKSDQIAYSFGDSSQTYKNIYLNLEKLKTKNIYFINKMAINVLNLLANPADSYNSKTTEDFTKYELHELFSGPIDFSNHNQSFMSDDQKALITANSGVLELNNLPAGIAQQTSKLLVGEFLVYGDKIHPDFAISKSGQIIHINKHKITLRKGQPIFVSPQAILHKYDGDFVDEQTSVITLAYQQLKTGDIVQGIPKIEQFFEARTTKRGRLFRDSLENLLKALFNRYVLKLPREQAVRQSFYKIQQIIIDGVQRVYRSQGVTIADKHLEVIVKQMTSKVRITFGGSTGYLPGEICDLYDIELLNKDIRPKILYEPIVLGITKASLEVKSFLSAASFQQTTRVLTKSALSRKNDYLNGLKENVILGNLIPAGTGYLVYLDGDGGSMTPLKHLA